MKRTNVSWSPLDPIGVIDSCSMKRLSFEQSSILPVVAIACIQPWYHAEGFVAIVPHGLEIAVQKKIKGKTLGRMLCRNRLSDKWAKVVLSWDPA